MADQIFCSRAAILLAALACACGGSSQGDGAGGASSAGAPAGGGARSSGTSGSNGASGSPATANPNGSSGSGASGAGNAPGSTDNGSCPNLTPCGGDIVGEWTLKEVCFDIAPPAALLALCPDATFRVSPATATGMVSFKADNTMSSSATISFQEFVGFPNSCLTADECTAFGNQISTAAGVTGGQCSYDASTGCSCSLTSNQPSMSTGTYQVQGTNVTVTNATSGATEVDSFCVSGDTLRVRGPSNNGNSANLVLTR